MAINTTRALQRSIAISRLHVPTYEEVERDTSATAEAGAIVALVAVVGSLGALFRGKLGLFIASIIILLIGWLIWAWLSAFIATRLFNVTTTDMGEMQRTTGYAYFPQLLGIVPFLGFVGMLWSLVAIIIGMRQAAEMSTIQAIMTALIGFLPAIIAMAIVTAILT
jgi:hypothetical protein